MSYMGILQGSGGSAPTGDQAIIAANAAGTSLSQLRTFNTDGATLIHGTNGTPAWLYLFAEENSGGFGAGNPLAVLPPLSFFEQVILQPTRQVVLVFNPLFSGQAPGTAFTLNNAAQVWLEAYDEKAFPAAVSANATGV